MIPTYNEVENIGPLLEAIFDLKEDFHVLVLDDNSPDRTAFMVTELQSRYPNRLHLDRQAQKQGIGRAYLRGFQYALQRPYEYVLQMDADFSHNPKDLPLLLEACATDGYDLAIGSRYVRGVNVVNWPMSRVLLSYLASKYVRFITGLPIHDVTAGFVCYRKEILHQIDLSRIHFTGYAFQIGIKHRIWKHAARIKEISVIFRDRERGRSKMSLSIFSEAFWGVFSLALQGLKEKYKPIVLEKPSKSVDAS